MKRNERKAIIRKLRTQENAKFGFHMKKPIENKLR